MRWNSPGITGHVGFAATDHSERMWLMSQDGTRLYAELHASGANTDLGIVVGHGFTNHVRKRVVQDVLRRFARHSPTLGVDFRGHGRSDGRTTVSIDEAHDVTAAIDHLRALGCRRVVTVGFSLGAAVAIRQAALAEPGHRPDGIVAVSSPVRWWTRDSPAMRRVHWLLEQPHGRWSARLIGVRLGPEWAGIPVSPIELAAQLRSTPLLVVHGTDDHYFAVDEARTLADVAGGELWVEPGMGHAESATTPDLVDRMIGWVTDTVG